MLHLSRTFTGEPGELLGILPLQVRTVLVSRPLVSFHFDVDSQIWQVYPSSDTLIVRNVETLEVERILSFWEVFPAVRVASGIISDIVVDPGLKLVNVTLALECNY
jgi:hypothetical protein